MYKIVRLGDANFNGGGEMVELVNKQTCAVCDNQKEKGLNVYNLFICSQCEQKMVKTEPEDPSYAYFVEKLKRLNHLTSYS